MLIKQVISAGTVMATGRLVNLISQFLFNALLVRILLKQDVADFFLTVSLVSFFSMLVTYGGANIAIRRFSEAINQQTGPSTRHLLIKFITVNVITTTITLVLFLLFQTFFMSQLFKIEYSVNQLLIIFCWIWALGLQAILTEIFRAFGKFLITMFSNTVLCSLLNLVFVASLFYYQCIETIDDLFLIVSFNAILVTLVSIVVARKLCLVTESSSYYSAEDDSVENSSVEDYSVSHIIKDSTPSFVNKLGLYFTVIADLWLIALFYTKDIVADYGIALKLAAILALFLSIVNGFVPTFIGRLKTHGTAAVEQFLRVIATLVFIPSLLLFALLFIYAELVIETIFGVEYLLASQYLRILLLGQLINVLVGSCSYMLVMEGKNAQLMKVSIATGIMAIVLASSFAATDYAAEAIAWSFSSMVMLRQLLVYFSARKYSQINTAIYFNPLTFSRNLKILIDKSYDN